MLARSHKKLTPTVCFDAAISNVLMYLGLDSHKVYLSGALATYQLQLNAFGIEALLWQKETMLCAQDTLMMTHQEWTKSSQSLGSGIHLLILSESISYWKGVQQDRVLRAKARRLTVQTFVILSSLKVPVRVLDYDKKVLYDYYAHLNPSLRGVQWTINRLKNILKTICIRPNCWLIRT